MVKLKLKTIFTLAIFIFQLGCDKKNEISIGRIPMSINIFAEKKLADDKSQSMFYKLCNSLRKKSLILKTRRNGELRRLNIKVQMCNGKTLENNIESKIIVNGVHAALESSKKNELIYFNEVIDHRTGPFIQICKMALRGHQVYLFNEVNGVNTNYNISKEGNSYKIVKLTSSNRKSIFKKEEFYFTNSSMGKLPIGTLIKRVQTTQCKENGKFALHTQSLQ